MFVELRCFTLCIDQILSKVPLDFTFRKLLFEVLVDGVGTFTNTFCLFKNWELSLVVFLHPSLDLLARFRFLCSKLVARHSNDLETTAVIFIVHLFVLAVVPIRVFSLRGNIDENGNFALSHQFFQTTCLTTNFRDLAVKQLLA